jgi:uncharacterized protein (TIGR03083 family)
VTTAQLYAAIRAQMLALGAGLSAEEAETAVPALPGWSVKDAYGHLTGLCADVLDGRMDDAGSPAWTARQVVDRAGRSLPEVCDEWRQRGPALDQWLDDRGGDGTVFVGFDVWNHHQDVRSALGLPRQQADEHIDYLLDHALRAFDQRFREADIAAVRVVTPRVDRDLGAGPPDAVLRTTDYELLRTLFGRRSHAQMTNADWDGDPANYVDQLHLFELPVADLVD